MDATRGILVLSDGDLTGALACAFAREAVAVCPADNTPIPLVAPFPSEADPSRADAVRRQAARFALTVVPGFASPAPSPTQAEREHHELIAAAFGAASRRCAEILWPATAATGEDADLDRVAKITDRALLVGRLVASETETHAQPGLRISTPFADLGFRQLADLALDLDIPLEVCWWWKDASPDADAARQCWTGAFARAGWDLPRGVPLRHA